MNRREVLTLAVHAAAVTGAGRLLLADARAEGSGRYDAAFARLDTYVAQFLQDMNAPGLTLVLADAGGVQRVCAYGTDDLVTHTPLDVDDLFHIGSITKSFLGLCLVQLQEEGKLDLQRPVHDYLPSLRFDGLTRPLTAHDLLTHAAALPDGNLCPGDPAFRHRGTAAPGTTFHYCNMAFEALGHLLVKLDGRPLAECFRARLLEPLGMTATEPVISFHDLERYARSYQAALNDRPFPRLGRLVPSPPIYVTEASGSIASTARDMGAYLTMLINGGRTPKGRVVSEAGFELFAQPHNPAEHFGPGASYGYGIAVDKIDDHRRLRHTGGMVSFASALEVDRDSRVGVFASINAMQGFRPRPVAEYALRLMRACVDGKPLPDVPASESPLHVETAQDYAGTYTAADGRKLDVVAEGDRLFLQVSDGRLPLEPWVGTENAFIVPRADFAEFALHFTRSGADGKGPVVAAGWGNDWYPNARYTGPRKFNVPAAWQQYVGHYRSEDPWIGSHRVSLRAGQLWLDGIVPLEASSDGRFFFRDEPQSPEWARFSDALHDRTLRMCLSGYDLKRV